MKEFLTVSWIYSLGFPAACCGVEIAKNILFLQVGDHFPAYNSNRVTHKMRCPIFLESITRLFYLDNMQKNAFTDLIVYEDFKIKDP
jgi:hypothetical protein